MVQYRLFHAARRLQLRLLDFDAFYAPKTQLDAQGRRVLWGWVPERHSEDAMRKAGWSGMMGLPRVLRLDEDGTLRMDPLPEISSLRGIRLTTGSSSTTIPGATGEFVCNGRPGEAFSLQLTLPEGDLLTAIYDPVHHVITTNGHATRLLPQDVPQIRGFVDGSVLEVFIASRSAYTKRFYYEARTAPNLDCRIASGVAGLEAWTVLPISHNRLTDAVA